MSIVQAAMERLKANRSADPRSRPDAKPGESFNPTATGTFASNAVNLPPSITWPDVTGPVVDVSGARLVELGLYPHAEYEHRQHDDYRAIRREVISAMRQRPAPDRPVVGPIVVVTSPLPGEGKSYTALNLALSVASEGIHNVVLIDGDTVRRSLTTALGLANEPGLLELLARSGRSFMEFARPTTAERLRVLPAGQPFSGASDLFSFGRVGPLFAAINSALDGHVAIIDTAPILLSSETPVLTDSAGQVLLVVRANHTLQDSVKEAVARIKETVPVGLILNDWDPLLASERQAYRGYEDYAKK